MKGSGIRYKALDRIHTAFSVFYSVSAEYQDSSYNTASFVPSVLCPCDSRLGSSMKLWGWSNKARFGLCHVSGGRLLELVRTKYAMFSVRAPAYVGAGTVWIMQTKFEKRHALLNEQIKC